MQSPQASLARHLTRRSLFGQSALGLGSAALAAMLSRQSQAATTLPTAEHWQRM